MLRAQQCADGNVREMCLILFDGDTPQSRMSPMDTPPRRAGAQSLCAGSTEADVVGWARPVGKLVPRPSRRRMEVNTCSRTSRMKTTTPSSAYLFFRLSNHAGIQWV